MHRPAEDHPKVSTAWAAFHERLTAALETLDEDRYLILIRTDTNHFVQFAAQGFHGMRAEVVSNAFLEPPERIPAAGAVMLAALGWDPPTSKPGTGPAHDPDGSPNHFREWGSPVDHAAVAAAAIGAFVEVLGVPHPGRLAYESFTSEGVALEIPDLGLRPARL